MMGGDQVVLDQLNSLDYTDYQDASSKGIFGTARTETQEYFLIVDPHYVSSPSSPPSSLVEEGWLQWVSLSHFDTHSFYNLCLPQTK